MFSNSKMSEIDPRGGVSIFQISLKSKKSEISDRGACQAYFGKCPKFSRFLIMTPPPTVFLWTFLIPEKFLVQFFFHFLLIPTILSHMHILLLSLWIFCRWNGKKNIPNKLCHINYSVRYQCELFSKILTRNIL